MRSQRIVLLFLLIKTYKCKVILIVNIYSPHRGKRLVITQYTQYVAMHAQLNY
jgi:hypothetical protein